MGPDWRWLSWRQTAALARDPAAVEEPGAAGLGVPQLLAAAAAQPAGDRIAARLGGGQVRGLRDLAVVHGPPADPAAAALAGWSVRSGAALLIEPDPARWPLALVWARPTVVAGSAHDLNGLAERLARLEREPRRLLRRRGPLGRVRVVVRLGAGEWASADWWRMLALPIHSLEP